MRGRVRTCGSMTCRRTGILVTNLQSDPRFSRDSMMMNPVPSSCLTDLTASEGPHVLQSAADWDEVEISTGSVS
jgi:hypothetical protein